MRGELTLGETLTALMLLTGGGTIIAFGILASVLGYVWQPVAFAAGGAFVVRAGWLRLSRCV